MSWFICSVSRHEPDNWSLCKEVGLWGVPGGTTLGPSRQPKEGDQFLFWLGGRGYVGYGLVTSEPRTPASQAETPWPGGAYRFGLVVPFKLELEVAEPYQLRFVKGRQEETGLSTSKLQLGFAGLPDDAANKVVAKLLERKQEEDDSLQGV